MSKPILGHTNAIFLSNTEHVFNINLCLFIPQEPHHRRPMFRPMKSMACLESCASNTSCPSRDQVAGAMDRILSNECRNCVHKQCGELMWVCYFLQCIEKAIDCTLYAHNLNTVV